MTVDQAVLLGEADRDLALGTIELGLRLERMRAAFSAAGLGASQVRATRPESACFEAARFPGRRR